MTFALTHRDKTPPPRPLRFRLLNLAMRAAPIGLSDFGNSVLFVKNLADPVSVTMSEKFTCRWAGPEDASRINAHPEAEQPGAYARRLARGDRCICLFEDDDLIGFQWMAFASARATCKELPPWEILFLPLSATQAYLYDLFVYSKHRRRQLGLVIRTLSFRGLHELGYRSALSLADVHNEPALRLRKRSGESPLRIVYSYHVGPWRKCFFGPTEDLALQRWWKGF